MKENSDGSTNEINEKEQIKKNNEQNKNDSDNN